ncbi:MAG: hypothetical protein M1819_001984 [Sarea resinae]|nr:MAG: hypothetical protein M1819_001984 [Sarea resinae]
MSRGGSRFRKHQVIAAEHSDYSGSSDAEASDQPSQEEQEESPADISSDEEDAKPTVRPYNALLQSLTGDLHRGQPQRKKRKTEQNLPEERTNGLKTEAETDKVDGEVDVDLVEEPEEGAEPVADSLAEAQDIDEDDDASDPFEVHFANPDENVLATRLQAISQNKWHMEKVDSNDEARLVLYTPEVDAVASVSARSQITSPNDLKLKRKLRGPATKLMPQFDAVQKVIAPYIFNYQDLLFCGRTPANAESLRRLTYLHALNHIFKTRDRVIKNNARLAKEEDGDDLDLRDQGFTRPKVLVLLPTRQSCVRAVETILELCETEQQENKKRFQESYVAPTADMPDERPEDFRELFAGNSDDMFRLGMKFTRKTVKFFSQFYNSDIIFASPLGLRMAIGSADDPKKQDHDFLSSIELLVISQADALLQQNWSHIPLLLNALNQHPTQAHNTDFSRVRTYYLDAHARNLRQTLVFTAYNTPEINSVFNTQMSNVFGKAKYTPVYESGGSGIQPALDLGLAIHQTFSRFDSPPNSTPAADPDARFAYFTASIVPWLLKNAKQGGAGGAGKGGAGILIFIPSYLDFVRVRNHLSTSTSTAHLSFSAISEYSSASAVARARTLFFSGRISVLLYTQRAHHFRRYRLRGVKKLVLYELPDNPVFYREIAGGFLGRSVAEGLVAEDQAAVRVVFGSWDGLRLERVVGAQRARGMITGKGGDTWDFV